MMLSWVASSMGISPVFFPSHMTRTLSLIRRISAISEEIMMMDLPCFTSSFIK